MKTVIITEKPSVAREYVKVLRIHPDEKTDGYVEGYSPVMGKQVAVTWCIGHLVTMSYPEVYDADLKKWTLDALPFLPTEYLYEVVSDAGIKKQFGIVRRLYNSADLEAIYYAGDSGREGIYIQELVRKLAGHKAGIKEKVVWIDSQTEDEILRGIREAKDISCYSKLIDSAYMRAIEDFAVGINFSRALSCKYGFEFNKRIASKSWSPLSVGRVMTCVLGMITKREREIRNFIPTPFYRIEADTGFSSEWRADSTSSYFESPLLYNETGFLKEDDARNLKSKFEENPNLTVLKIEDHIESKGAPLLYNLAELQFECSKKYKISPDMTLQIVQNLYEQKLVTYPRTDARVLSSAVAKEIRKVLSGLSKGTYSEKISPILTGNWDAKIQNSVYVNDAKITDHYAIIPTGQVPMPSSLSELEEAVYGDITRRFLAIFYPAAKFQKVDAVLAHENGEHFYASEKVLFFPGWYEVYPKESRPEEKKQILAHLKEGGKLAAKFEIKEGSTTAPKRYTSGSIILAMENAGKMIEDEELRAQIKGSGIGTSATRAEIIKKLVKNGYVTLNAKTQVLSPSHTGETLYDIVMSALPELLSPEMTANWEKGLSSIESGALPVQKYRDTLEQYVRASVDKIKRGVGISYENEAATKKESEILGHCPVCNSEVLSGKFGAYCKGKCGMQLAKAMGKELNDSQIKSLLSGKKTLVKGLTSNKGKKYDAYLIPNGTESFSYQKDGETKTGHRYKFTMEFKN